MPNPKMNVLLALAALVSLALTCAASAEDALIKPVPTPDLSKLAPDKAAEVRDTRSDFEKVKGKLVGDPLIQAYALLGATYARAGLYDAAAVAMDDAMALSPKDARWVYSRGIIARMQGNANAARSYFEQALALDPDYLPIRMAVAGQHVEQGDLEGARKLLTDYVAKDQKQAIVYAMLGDVDLRQQRYAVSIEHTKRALDLDPKATKLYTQLAEAYSRMGDSNAAAQMRARAGDGVPALGDPIALGLMPQAAASGAGKTAGKPSAPPDNSVAKVSHEAMFLLTIHQYDGARKRLDEGLKAHPNDATLLATYAKVEGAAGRLDEARSRAEAAIDADPKSAEAELALGLVLEMGNDDRGAERAYDKALRLDAKLGEARVRLGNLMMRSGRLDDAIAQFRGLTQSAPGDGEAWSRMIGAEVVAGRCNDAIRDVNGGLAKEPNNAMLLQLFVRLTSTCGGGNPEEKRMALDYAGKIYSQSDAAPIGEAYALALAANGKWDDAVKIQQAAMFVLVRNGRGYDLPGYKETLADLKAHKLPARPWSSDSVWFKASRVAPDPKQPAK